MWDPLVVWSRPSRVSLWSGQASPVFESLSGFYPEADGSIRMGGSRATGLDPASRDRTARGGRTEEALVVKHWNG